jgi:hypothetical protein
MTRFKKQNKSRYSGKVWNKIALVLCFLILGLIFVPFGVQASRIYFSPLVEKIYKDDIFFIEIRISSPDKLINAVEGVLLFDKEKLEVEDLSDGGSIFTFWPQKLAFSNEEGKVSFVAGTPNGFRGENALVLKIIFLAKETGEAKLDFQDTTSFFLHDGKGTPLRPWLKSLTIDILERQAGISPKNDWQSLIEKDKTPPQPFEIQIGRDPAIFDNQYFISFFTTDKESGVAYYEVKEGNRDFVQAESPYLLKDQSLKSLIKVKAIDKAGNERIVELTPALPFYKNVLFWLAVVLIILFIVYALRRIFWKRARK